MPQFIRKFFLIVLIISSLRLSAMILSVFISTEPPKPVSLMATCESIFIFSLAFETAERSPPVLISDFSSSFTSALLLPMITLTAKFNFEVSLLVALFVEIYVIFEVASAFISAESAELIAPLISTFAELFMYEIVTASS